MAKSPNWTEEEVEILTSKYPELGSGPEILKFLPGRTSKSVNVKASRMGLKIAFCRKWQEEELEILKNSYPMYGSSINIQKLLPNRTVEAIKIQAARLGIGCNTYHGKTKPLEVYLEELNIAGFTLLGEYNNSHSKTLHKCNKCHYEWLVLPGNIIQGSGCPNCASKFNFSYETGSIYLLKINTSDNVFLKLGITSRNILYRVAEIAKELDISVDSINVVAIKEGKGAYIFELEKSILTNNALARYTNTKKFSGSTELFNESEIQKITDIINDKIFS